MKTNNEALAFALRQTWLSPSEQYADNQAVELLLATEPPVSLPNTIAQHLLDRLEVRLVTPSLGQILQQQTATTDEAWQTEQTGFSAETLTDLRNDAIHPTSVPIMRMKRLIQFLQLPVQQAVTALQKTADRYHEQATPAGLAYAPLGRLANADRPVSTATLNGHFLFESDDALQIYLDQLNNELSNDQTLN